MNSLVLQGGHVLTPGGVVQADLVVEGGEMTRLAPVPSGALEGLAPRPPVGERTVDLGGRLVTPAFVDAHVHLAATGLAILGVDLSAAGSAAEALELLGTSARADDGDATGPSVLLAHGWDETRWPEATCFSRAELDRAVGDRPAYVARVDVHSAVVSTALLERLAGAAPTATRAPVHLGDLTRLTGWSDQGPLTRDAHHAVRGAVQELLSSGDRRAALGLALAEAGRTGVGLVHELGAPHLSDVGDFGHLDELADEAGGAGRALPRVLRYWGEPGALDLVRELGCLGAAGDICVDGAIGSRTAALHEPYADAPTRGHLYLTAEQVAEHVVACTEAGLQAGFHLIGDRAVAETVLGLQQAAEKLGAQAVREAHHRLEHVEMITPDQVEVLAELQVTASVQPVFDAWWGGPGGLYEQRLAERAVGMNPFATMAHAGVHLAFGSDSPVTPLGPWAQVRAAVHHSDPRQSISVQAALEAATVGGWHAAGAVGGRLEVGTSADLAVWDVPAARSDGLPTLEPGDPLPTCVLTLVGGLPAYDGGGLLR